MSNVLHFWAHKIDRKYVAETGLFYCPTCGGGEADLPEHCPQRRMTAEERIAVAHDELDFRRSEGGWTTFTLSKANRIKRLVT